MLRRTRLCGLAWLLALGVSTAFLAAQDEPADAVAEPAASETGESTEKPKVDLSQAQQQIENDFQRFEEELFKLSEQTRGEDPDRADLLTRTRSQSRERRVLRQMEIIAALLEEGGELGDAVERQQEVVAELQALLKLLQSEDERDRLAAEIARLEDLLKDTGKIIGAEKDVRADTERQGDPSELEDDQERVADLARDLADKIDRQDAERAAENAANGSPSEGEASEGESSESESAEGEPSDEPQDGESEHSETKPSESDPQEGEPGEKPEPGEGEPMPSAEPGEGSPSKPQDGSSPPQEGGSKSKPQEGSPSDQQGSPSQSPQSPSDQESSESSQQQTGNQSQDSEPGEQTPGREELEQAIEEMEQAIEELKQQDHDAASDEQDQALAELEALKARLEEILRQLREKERELFLAMLEARFQEMLRVQLMINAETVRLDKVPEDERESRHFTKATDLSRDQYENALEADQALLLLKEEGSSVAFPEAVEQMRDNMFTVVTRLEKADTGETTQLIEQIIVETLDEMILALQREMEKMKEQEQEPQDQEQQEQDPPLVDILAELKMIRSLQSQINRLTRQIGLQVDGDQAVEQDTINLLNDLSQRQQRIQEATYDLSTGKAALGNELK